VVNAIGCCFIIYFRRGIVNLMVYWISDHYEMTIESAEDGASCDQDVLMNARNDPRVLDN
jgi:hypothetical protein